MSGAAASTIVASLRCMRHGTYALDDHQQSATTLDSPVLLGESTCVTRRVQRCASDEPQ